MTHLSRLLERVAMGEEVVIAKAGTPVAKLVPVEEEPIDLFGYMAGTAKICGDIISPIDEDEWTGDAENI